MSPQEFLDTARNPLAWRSKGLSLRNSANVLWREFSDQLSDSISKETKQIDEEKLDDAEAVLRNSQFMYSLAAECFLKGLIIKQCPTDVVFDAELDGTGRLVEVSIKQIGKTRIDTHNLERLAEIAGVLQTGESRAMRELLAFSTFCINWIGRYPVPLSAGADFSPRGKLPHVVFGHYYRDLMDPFLDRTLAKLSA